MDTYQEMDFSQLCLNAPDSNVETNPTSSNCNDILNQNYWEQDIDFSPLLQAIPETQPTTLSCADMEPVSNVEAIPASSDFNDILNQTATDVSSFHQEISLSCNVNKPASVSNDQLSSLSTDGNTEKKSRLHTCLTCKKSFSRNSYLKRHSLIHEKKKIMVYTCSICNKTFSRNCNLQQHLPTHDKKIKVFECFACHKSFQRKSYLKRHLRIHTEEKLSVKITPPFNCSTCKESFSNNSYLKEHMKIHTSGKCFSCEVCFKAFSSKPHLKRHQLLHDNEKMNRSFKCEHCTYTFTRKDQLMNHISHYRNSTYACIECKVKFCWLNELRVHKREHHTVVSNQNPYCEMVKHFKRRNELTMCSTTIFDSCEDIDIDLHSFLNSLSSKVESEMKYQFFEKNYFKCTFMLEALVTSSLKDKENELYTLYLNSNALVIFSENMLTKCIEQVFTEMLDQYSKLEKEWKIYRIIKLEIFSIKFNLINEDLNKCNNE